MLNVYNMNIMLTIIIICKAKWYNSHLCYIIIIPILLEGSKKMQYKAMHKSSIIFLFLKNIIQWHDMYKKVCKAKSYNFYVNYIVVKSFFLQVSKQVNFCMNYCCLYTICICMYIIYQFMFLYYFFVKIFIYRNIYIFIQNI